MFFFSVLRRYFARTHTLPAPWSEIMARKNWNTLTEQTLQCGAAAFAFLKHYKSQRLAAHHVRLSHGVFSQFVIEHTLIQFEDGPLTLCLGHSTWGALCWPVREWTFGELCHGWWAARWLGSHCQPWEVAGCHLPSRSLQRNDFHGHWKIWAFAQKILRQCASCPEDAAAGSHFVGWAFGVPSMFWQSWFLEEDAQAWFDN